MAGLFPNVVSNPAHDRVDGDTGVEQMGEECLGERTVRAGLPIEGGGLRVAGESNERPARKIAVDTGQPPLDNERSRFRSRERSCEGVVTASVEDDDIDAVVALHLLE